MVSTRRMGSVTSAKAESMLDAAVEILREEGHAALTSRRVAEYLGVKQRLVYYYFRTMDDLILETFKRLAIRDLTRLKHAINSEHALHDIWEVCINTTDARLVTEFMALANRNESLRQVVTAFIEESRDLQVTALKNALAKTRSAYSQWQPEVIAFVGTSLALALNREAALGVKKCHSAVKKMVQAFFAGTEPDIPVRSRRKKLK